MTKRVKDGIAATLTIHKAAEMTEHGRLQVAKWIVRCAKDFDRLGKNYSKRFTARYRY